MGSQCGLGAYITCPGVVRSKKKVVEFDAMYGDVGSHNNLLYRRIVFTSAQCSRPIWYSACWFVVDIVS